MAVTSAALSPSNELNAPRRWLEADVPAENLLCRFCSIKQASPQWNRPIGVIGMALHLQADMDEDSHLFQCRLLWTMTWCSGRAQLAVACMHVGVDGKVEAGR